jgi:cellulose synthase/poly-beta-1,6-N-acetylglucosamine synthase-like glycosyltransferase
VEYLRAFLFGRLGWNPLGGGLIISGAFGLFRKEYLLGIGGYRTGSVVEDLDLVVRLHRYLRDRKIPDEIRFIPDPVAWTEVPASGRILGAQRERWHRGLLATLWTHRSMLLNPRFGLVGLVAMPFFTFGEMLAPVVEVAGWLFTIGGIALGRVDLSFALLLVLVAWGYGMVLSLWAIALEESTFRRYRQRGALLWLLWFAVIEAFGYRQRTAWWRLRAFWTIWRRGRGWGEMVRKGFQAP